MMIGKSLMSLKKINRKEIIINKLLLSVKNAKLKGEPMDSINWVKRNGVLISCDEAMFIIKLISKNDK